MQSPPSAAATGLGRSLCRRCQTRRHLRRCPVSHWLVCRVAHDTDTDHSRHSHEPPPLRSIARELAAHRDDYYHHGYWSGLALFAAGLRPRICPAAPSLLAHFAGDPALLRRPHPGHQDLADSQSMGLSRQPLPLILAALSFASQGLTAAQDQPNPAQLGSRPEIGTSKTPTSFRVIQAFLQNIQDRTASPAADRFAKPSRSISSQGFACGGTRRLTWMAWSQALNTNKIYTEYKYSIKVKKLRGSTQPSRSRWFFDILTSLPKLQTTRTRRAQP